MLVLEITNFQNSIFKLLQIINNNSKNENIDPELAQATYQALAFMHQDYEYLNSLFIDNSRDNIKKLAEKIESTSNNTNIQSELGNLIHDLTPIIFEYFIFIKIVNNEIFWKGHNSINDYINYIASNIEIFPKNIQREINKISIDTPVSITKQIIHHPSISVLRKFSQDFNKNEKFSDEWEIKFEAHQKKLNNLTTTIENLKSDYNFVGLVSGFQKIRTNKKNENLTTMLAMLFLSLTMVVLPIIISLNASLAEKIQSENYSALIAWLIPSLTIEVLILYYFRIFLQQYKSVQAQLLQIDLRVSLCQFIENYIKYKKDNSLQKDESLSKFESLIFSGIVADSGSIPSTFEGIEQLSTLFKSIGSAKT